MRRYEHARFANVWFSAPHAPFAALPSDKAVFEGLGLAENTENQFGMVLALDRAVGSIRQKLRDLNIEKNTLVWFLSDNGGITSVDPNANSGLRGQKSNLYEGGIRVPSIVEWPSHVHRPRS